MMAGGEIRLPEPIVQRVQYFLTSKEAARTSVLSKLWGSAWLTRPNLNFDQGDFGKHEQCSWGPFTPFLEFADKTLKRYEDSNLKIESFGLRIESWDYTRITNMIVRALKLGATRLALYTFFTRFLLPNEVFASENLIELTLNWCEIDLGLNRDVIRCSRLQSLSLDSVNAAQGYGEINFHDTLLRIISSCPLLEKLSLSHIPNSRDGGDGDLIVLPRLRSLVLAGVGPATLFLFTRGLSSSFPSLKDLTLEMYEEDQDNVEMLISSPSLERLSLHLKYKRKESWRFKFDVPSIRKFTYEGESIPSLSFRSTSSGGWESHVRIANYKSLHNSWFRRLSKLLTKLRRSRILLSLNVRSFLSFHHRVGDIKGLPKRMIENLTMDLDDMPYLNCYALLDGLFLLCRPKSITPLSKIDFIGETILQAGLNHKISTPKQFMYGLKDLEEARAQFFDSVVSQWRNVALDEFLDDSTSSTPPEDIRDVRFQLKWHS